MSTTKPLSMKEAADLVASSRALVRQRASGRGRSIDIAVHDVYCDTVEDWLTATVFVPSRKVCELAGVGHRRTVARSLSRLERLGVLRSVGSTRENSTRYRIIGDDAPVGAAFALRDKDLDIWRHHPTGIGPTAHLVHEALRDGLTMPSAIQRQTGASRPSVYRCLNRLAERGLAVHHDDGWAVGPIEPEMLGLGGVQNLRRYKAQQTNEQQRRAWEAKKAEIRAAQAAKDAQDPR